MKGLIKFSALIGLAIFAIFKLVEHFVSISDAIAIPTFLISCSFMLVGIAYHGWCFGKGKNPYGKN